MIRKKRFLLSCAVCFALAAADPQTENTPEKNPPSISGLFDGDDGVERFLDYQNRLGHFTTIDTTRDAYESCSLAENILDVTVVRKAYDLPPCDRQIFFESHMAWLRYYDTHPSRPTSGEEGSGRALFGLDTDRARVNTRLRAVRLPYTDYLLYDEIGNSCFVPLADRNVKMTFGEVRCVEPAPWLHCSESIDRHGKVVIEYPLFILPETCRRFFSASLNGFCAVFEKECSHEYYLCVWDRNGWPFALYVADDGEESSQENRKKRRIDTLCIENDAVKIELESDGKKSTRIFPLRRNDEKIPL
ncbi:MAG: hypothetical protein MJ016_07030 [Victivallaceae bacterium]|nr:hypothetical protein [Victivallaceae bacterium]